MENRIVELVAEGSSLGDHISLEVQPPKDRMRIGKESIFRMLLSSEEEGSVPKRLIPGKCRDATLRDEPFNAVETGDDVNSFEVKVTPNGDVGPCIWKVLVKGEKFGATLAVGEIETAVLLPMINVKIPEGTVPAENGSELGFDVHLSHTGKQKLKGTMSVYLGSGPDGAIASSENMPVSIGEGSLKTVRLGPLMTDSVGKMDVSFVFEIHGDRQRSRLKGAVEVKAEPGSDNKVPDRIRPGSPIEMDMVLPGEASDDGPKLLIDGEGPFPPEDRDDRGKLSHLVFRVPEIDKDVVEIVLLFSGRELVRRSVNVVHEKPLFRPTLECRPKVVSPGDTVRVELSLEGDAEKVNNVRVVPAKPSFDPVDMGKPETGGKLGCDMSISRNATAGKMDARLLLLSDQGDVLFEKGLPSMLEIRSRSIIEVKPILPVDRIRDVEGDATPYLFPEERVVRRSSYSGVDHCLTDRGRVVLLRGGRIVPAGEDDHQAPSSAILMDAYVSAFDRKEHIDGLEDALGSLKDLTGRVDGIPPHPSDGDKGFSAGLARSLIAGDKDPALSGDMEKGPPHVIVSALIGKLCGEEGIVQGEEPDLLLRDHVETMIRDMKGRDTGMDRFTFSFLLDSISERIRSSLEDLDRMLPEKHIDGAKMTAMLRRLLFYLLSYSLVWSEMAAGWSDPLVTVWEDLRIERQRSVKSSVQGVMDTAEMMIDIFRAARQRWKGYLSNVEMRRRLRSLSIMEIDTEPDRMSCTAGGSQEMEIFLKLPEGCVPVEVVPYISLPHGGWTLEHPRSLREGNLFVTDRMTISPGKRKTMPLRISVPPSGSDRGTVKVYFHPEGSKLEEEP